MLCPGTRLPSRAEAANMVEATVSHASLTPSRVPNLYARLNPSKKIFCLGHAVRYSALEELVQGYGSSKPFQFTLDA